MFLREVFYTVSYLTLETSKISYYIVKVCSFQTLENGRMELIRSRLLDK